MAYIVPRSDGVNTVTVENGSVNSSPPLTIGLLGRNTIDYGNTVATTQVQLLENFAAAAQPVNPVAGQLWYKKDTQILNVNTGTSDGEQTWSALISTSDGNNIGSPSAPFDAIYVKSIWGADTGETGVMNGTWTLAPGSSFRATYADLAERFAADAIYEPGTVVRIGGDKEVTQTLAAYDDTVFGVISTNPAYVMNEAAGDDATHPPVALAGRVPVKITGPVKKGDRIVASGLPGVAKAAEISRYTPLAIIGRALEDKEGDSVSLVMVVVGAK